MSRGQIPRTPDNFPRMNYRAGRRRHRRAVKHFAEVQRRLRASLNNPGLAAERIGRRMWAEQEAARESDEPPYDRGGLIEPGWTLVTLDVAECIIPSASLQDGTLRCGRTDEAHLYAAHHGRPIE